MIHPTDRQLIEHVTRRLDAGEAQEVMLHLTACAACRLRAEQCAALYPVLGSWETPAGRRDFAQSILAVVEKEQRDRRWKWEYARVAAAVVVAIGLGHWTARTLRTPASEPAPPDAAAAAQTVGLDALAGSDSEDLDFVLQFAQAEGGLQ
jgi:hypothetical protein